MAENNVEYLSHDNLNGSKRSLSTPTRIGLCSICCEEEAPLVNLLGRCKNHEPACKNCLKRLYVTMAQKDISSYPIQCFHPSCNKTLIREENLVRHGIIAEDSAELARHRRLSTLARGNRWPGSQTLHCPTCDYPRVIRSLSEDDGKSHLFGCFNCSTTYMAGSRNGISPETDHLLQRLRSDRMGANHGWAWCPNCQAVISKGDGCDHMYCMMCRHDFSWNDAQEHKKQILLKYPMAKTSQATDNEENRIG